MVIVSPHTELAQAPPEVAGTERSQKLKPEKSKLGVFAKILAGMSGKAAVRNTKEQLLSENTAIPDETAHISGGKAKNIRGSLVSVLAETETALTDVSDETIKTAGKKGSKNGVAFDGTGNETAGFTFLQQEKGPVSPIERLIVQAEEVAEAETGLLEVNAAEAGISQESGELLFRTGSLEGVTSDGGFPLLGEAAFSVEETVKLSAAEKNKACAENAGGAVELASAENTEMETVRPDDGKKAVLTTAEKNGRGKLEEVRGREKRRASGLERQDSVPSGGYGENTSVSKEENINIRAAEIRLPDETGKDIVLELRLSSAGQEAQHTANSWETNSGRAFEDMLARELHQNFNNDIVRHASVALRDGGEGTIRLALKPETLGNVKIRLEMAENKITGHILVETEEALRAFEREIGSLEKAFRDFGFEVANMQMSLAADGGEAQQQWRETKTSRVQPGFFTASRYDAAADWQAPAILDLYGQGTQAVNVLA